MWLTYGICVGTQAGCVGLTRVQITLKAAVALYLYYLGGCLIRILKGAFLCGALSLQYQAIVTHSVLEL